MADRSQIGGVKDVSRIGYFGLLPAGDDGSFATQHPQTSRVYMMAL